MATTRSGESLLSRVEELGPLIRDHAEAAERDRRLSPEVIHALTQAGLYRVLLPRSPGGFELDPVTCSLVSERVSSIDSARRFTAGTPMP